MRLIIFFISILTLNSLFAQTKNKSLFYPSQKIDFLHFFNYNNRQAKVDTNAFYTNANYNVQYGNAQTFGLLYKQKLNPYLDLQLNLIKFSREGLLQNEEIKNHEFDLIAHFSNKLDNYKSYLHFGSEKYLLQENGGVINFDYGSVSDPSFYSVSLSQALNYGHNHFYSYNQSYQLSDNVKLVNNSNYYRKYRIYEDSNPNPNYYPNIYNDSTSTFDSTYFSNFTNQIGIQVQNFQLSYVYKNLSNWHASNDSVFVDNGLSFQAQFSPKKIDIDFNLQYYTSASYLSTLSFSLADSNLLLSLGSQKPLIPVFTNSYSSNHFQFNTNFTDYRKHSASLVYQLNKLKLSTVLYAHQNFIYLNEQQLFVQNPDLFYHSKSTIDYKWKFGLLNGYHSFNYQLTSNDQVFRVPSLQLYSDLYLNTLLFDASLDFKIGSTISFFTSYYGNRYSPALAQFYLQNEQLIGDYPFMTAYANLMVESVNIEFQLVNIFDLLSDKVYYTSPDIPYFGSPFQLSISWKLD